MPVTFTAEYDSCSLLSSHLLSIPRLQHQPPRAVLAVLLGLFLLERPERLAGEVRLIHIRWVEDVAQFIWPFYDSRPAMNAFTRRFFPLTPRRSKISCASWANDAAIFGGAKPDLMSRVSQNSLSSASSATTASFEIKTGLVNPLQTAR